jgi:hypothetical protein
MAEVAQERAAGEKFVPQAANAGAVETAKLVKDCVLPECPLDNQGASHVDTGGVGALDTSSKALRTKPVDSASEEALRKKPVDPASEEALRTNTPANPAPEKALRTNTPAAPAEALKPNTPAAPAEALKPNTPAAPAEALKPNTPADAARDSNEQGQEKASDARQLPGWQSRAGVPSTEEIREDGSKVRSGPGGVVVENPGGSVTHYKPDGTEESEEPKSGKNADGTEYKIYPYDGRKETSGFDENDPKDTVTEWPDGRKETLFKDGHKETEFPKDDPDGRVSETVSDGGNVTTTKYKDGRTEQVDSRTGDKTISYPPHNGQPGYNVVITTDADGKTVVKREPYKPLTPVTKENPDQ